ncbi:MAG: cytochrome c [Burkholderiaceae bacterium]|nr:cytochrome c [Burkholderiaceae bacterium]
MKLASIPLLVCAGLVSFGAQAADMAKARQTADTVCKACHGADGDAPTAPNFPRLAGQHADYLEQALLAYKSGARKDPTMAAQVTALSRDDISALAKYFASKHGKLSHAR